MTSPYIGLHKTKKVRNDLTFLESSSKIGDISSPKDAE